MNRVLIFFVAAVMFSSCKSYQMNTVSSLDVPQIDSTGLFRLENDTLIISYSFKGEYPGMSVDVFNKLDEPLFVNWAKSALIVNNVANSYVDDQIQINGRTSNTAITYRRSGVTYSDGDIAATAKLSKDESFIPPHSSLSKSTFKLASVDLTNVDKSLFKKGMTAYRDGSGTIPLKEATFTSKDTPLFFRNYLTFYTVKDGTPKLFAKEHNFYISSIEKTNTDPNELYRYHNKPNNVLINTQGSGGKILMIAGATAALGIGAALVENNETKR